jgi:hypothetical protein
MIHTATSELERANNDASATTITAYRAFAPFTLIPWITP